MPLGDLELIEKFFKGLTASRSDVVIGIGDDAAVLAPPPGHELVVSADMLVAGVHFFEDAAPFDVGFKSLAVNLSDMAAMGAEPRWATLALSLPRADSVWLDAFSRGLAHLAGRFQVALVGGDLASGPLTVSVQILGVVPQGAALRRDRARPGDLVFVTGELGAAGFALEALKHGSDPRSIAPACLERLLRPLPRVAAGQRLRAVADAAIDVSDGLVSDLGHIVAASGVAAEVDLERIPLPLAMGPPPPDSDDWRIALATGDDYELCFTVSPGRADAVTSVLQGVGHPVTCIGRILAGDGIRWKLPDGSDLEAGWSGYRHF
ncbi:MAG: thiamine-phosphate kinase [Gammaproteobacteria bacterium]|nr:thiamine-phosphate kinase [Gammaproteobacteria bacterium]